MSTHASFHRPDVVNEQLYVITTIYNPQRYKTRWKHYLNFQKHIMDGGAFLVTIEATFGHRESVVTQEYSHNHLTIHVKTNHELWLKENLNNVATQHLLVHKPDARYIAYVDADMHFVRTDWVRETIQKLQHYHVVQMFSEVVYLTPDGEKHSEAISFMEGWRRGIPLRNGSIIVKDETFYKKNPCKIRYGQQFGWTGAPGGAWAYRREALDLLGGLLDFAILGSADHYMALGLFDLAQHIIRQDFHPEYIQWILEWQRRAVKHLNRNIGHVKGTMIHNWHGKLSNRQYGNRNDVLVRNGFNPRTDLRKDTQGLWQLNDDKWQLRDDIRSYFSIRDEDSTDL